MEFLQARFSENQGKSKSWKKLDYCTEKLPADEIRFFNSVKTPDEYWHSSQKFNDQAKEEVNELLDETEAKINRKKEAKKKTGRRIEIF